MNFPTRSTLLATGVLTLLAVPSAQAQIVVRPAPVYAQPYVYVAPRPSAAVLPGFAPRGGIGTTPFLGNSRGLGAYSHNFDADYRRPVPQSRVNNRRWFRRGG